jgi:TonB family protein
MRLYKFLLIVGLCLLPRAYAQSSEAQIKSRLAGKPLYLRGCWQDDTLQFNSAGQLSSVSQPGPFTLCGFEFKEAHIKGDKLLIEGWRIGLELIDFKQKRVLLKTGRAFGPQDEPIHIKINAAPNFDYTQVLDAIFTEGLTELVPSLPSYWQKYAQENFLPAVDKSWLLSAQPVSDSKEDKPKRIGSGITPPKIAHAVEPAFDSAARALHYSGKNRIHLWVQKDGTVTHLSIVQALGLGLDERALAAVQRYTFEPATKDGKPIVVELDLEVNFEIY